MRGARWLTLSERWFRVLLRLYPRDFREEHGTDMVEAYRDRSRATLERGGPPALLTVCAAALWDSARNGLGERVRPAVSWRRSGSWGRDAQVTVRRLRRAPAFVLATVCTLTVGLGAFAVVYTAYHKVLVAPMPYEDPDELYYVWRDLPWWGLDRAWLSLTDVAEFQRVGGVIEGAAALFTPNPQMTVARSEEANAIEAMVFPTTPNLFDLLGVRPAMGRGFLPEEVGPDRPQVVVLTHTLWRRLGADPDILGTDVLLDGNPWTVIGVMGPDFRFVVNASMTTPFPADAFTPLLTHPAEGNPNFGNTAGIIRARPGTPRSAVEAAVARVASVIDERDDYQFAGQGLRLYPTNLREDLVAPARPALTVLAVAGAFLVLVLLVNLATLLLARAAQREREFAVARALGANPVALARSTVLEGGVLGLLGGVGGVLVGIWGTRMLVSMAPLDLPRRDAIVLDAPIALLVLGTGLLVGLVAGAGPGLWAARTRLGAVLGSMRVRGGGARATMRRGLVVAQVALSLVLLTAGALVVRSFDRLLRVDPGFQAGNVLTFRVPVTGAASPGAAGIHGLHERIEAELAALPGVASVGAASAVPLAARSGVSQGGVTFPGAPGNTGDPEVDAPMADLIVVRPGFFETMGVRLLEGRSFQGAPPTDRVEAIIDRTLARQFFPDGGAVGAIIPEFEVAVIGVVDHMRRLDVHRDGPGQIYLRNDAPGPTHFSLTWAVRTSGRPPASLSPDVRAALQRVDSRLPLVDVRPVEAIVDDALRQQRISAVLIGGFSLGALLLAAMGLFGLISGSVTRRRHELAVRIALGAGHDRLLRLVMKEGASLVLLGLLIGLPGVYFAGRLLYGMLYGISPWDPATLVAVAAGLTLVALAATYVPARRVLGIEPARSLREE